MIIKTTIMNIETIILDSLVPISSKDPKIPEW